VGEKKQAFFTLIDFDNAK